MDPIFLEAGEVIRIHEDQINRYGGSHGVRDEGLLESALGMPSASFAGEYLHTDIHEMAAAYLFHLVMNHPFVDGNKRVGALAAYVFLELNGLELIAPHQDYTELVLAIAKGEQRKPDIALFFRKWTRELKD